MRYFGLTGSASALELDAFLNGAYDLPREEVNKLILALNEQLMEMDHDARLPYR